MVAVQMEHLKVLEDLVPKELVLMALELDRTRDLFHRGLKLVDTLKGRLKLDVALFTRGGMKVLDAIERQGFDVLSRRPELSKAAKLRLMLATTVKLKMGFGA